jgi:translation initiation factor 4E
MASESPPVEGDGKLLRQWSLWYLVPDRYQMHITDWSDFLHVLNTFGTIDEMWATLNSVGKAAQLPKGSRFYIFKLGVQPLWEDRANQGGRLISIEHPIANAKKPKISDRWTDLVLAVVGESIANAELINGIEFTVRKQTYNICVWVSPCDDARVAVLEKELARLVRWATPIKVSVIDVARNGS